MPKTDTSWKPGQSGNPKGRPKGSRDTINEAFLKDLAADWRKNGAEALKKAREERPAEYCRMVANLIPREAKMQLDVQSETQREFLKALKAMNASESRQIDQKPKIIEGVAEEIDKFSRGTPSASIKPHP
jgi:hypothetical protein